MAGDIDDADEVGQRLQEVDAAEKASGASYQQRGSSFAIHEGELKWQCHLCCYAVCKPTPSTISLARTKHLKQAHDGKDLPGRVQRVPISLQKLPKKAAALWKYPLCP